jgi:hypothetical protein
MDSERMHKELRRALIADARRLSAEASLIRHSIRCPYDHCQRCCDSEAVLKAACERAWKSIDGERGELRDILGEALREVGNVIQLDEKLWR